MEDVYQKIMADVRKEIQLVKRNRDNVYLGTRHCGVQKEG